MAKASIDWAERSHWIFDMDGTLTVAQHDFDAFKRDHGLPVGTPILESLAVMPADDSGPIHAALRAWELELARAAQPAAGAHDLLHGLSRRGLPVAILTRNTREVAIETLRATELLEFFDPADVAGRDCAAPKPSPDGVLRQLRRWSVSAQGAVMVGDYVFDVVAGRSAGTATILVDAQGRFGPVDAADLVVGGLGEIHQLL